MTSEYNIFPFTYKYSTAAFFVNFIVRRLRLAYNLYETILPYYKRHKHLFQGIKACAYDAMKTTARV